MDVVGVEDDAQFGAPTCPDCAVILRLKHGTHTCPVCGWTLPAPDVVHPTFEGPAVTGF